MPFVRRLLLAVASGLLSISAAAQTAVGITSGFTGPVAAGVKENLDGARLYIDAVNAAGGVNGERIELVPMDDEFKPALAAQNARTLITKKNVIALFLSRGTPHTEAIRPLLDEFKVPMVAPSTGAMVLHQPVHPWIFNVRATYQREAERAVTHVASIGVSRIGIVQVDDSFGNDSATGALRGMAQARLQPVFHVRFNRNKPDLRETVQRAVETSAQVIVFIGAAATVADGTRALRAGGSSAQIVTLSNNASGGFIEQMGEHARGTIVSQVFPPERSMSAPMVREAVELASSRGMTGVTPAMLEGFAGAKVLVEGLRRAGPAPSRQKLRDALEGLRRFDVGGLELGYSPTDHTGLDFVDLSIIGPDGHFRR